MATETTPGAGSERNADGTAKPKSHATGIPLKVADPIARLEGDGVATVGEVERYSNRYNGLIKARPPAWASIA